MPVGTPGGTVPLFFNFYNEQTGVLTDPATVQLDITFGSEVGFVPDVAGPFAYSGASSPAPNTVFRIGVGQYGFVWQIPAAVPTGIYTANWTVLFGTDLLLGVENFAVTGGFSPPVPAGDIGYWTGSIDYEPPDWQLREPVRRLDPARRGRRQRHRVAAAESDGLGRPGRAGRRGDRQGRRPWRLGCTAVLRRACDHPVDDGVGADAGAP